MYTKVDGIIDAKKSYIFLYLNIQNRTSNISEKETYNACYLRYIYTLRLIGPISGLDAR